MIIYKTDQSSYYPDKLFLSDLHKMTWVLASNALTDTKRDNVATAAVPPEEKIQKKPPHTQNHHLFQTVLSFLLSEALFPVPEECLREPTARSVPGVLSS